MKSIIIALMLSIVAMVGIDAWRDAAINKLDNAELARLQAENDMMMDHMIELEQRITTLEEIASL